MSYTVFALKWRPQDFDQIIGQPSVVATLKNQLKTSRLGHAFLFAGPRGVGKTSTARILAKALNCKNGPTVTPCQKCPSCLEIASGRSLDVIEIDGASNRGIDEIRTLREGVKFAPTQGRFKVYIIDEVHQITPDGFNALLKTLEEPPPYVKFIFATTHPHKVIPTVLSRCQRFDFRRIGIMEIVSQLEKISAAEKIDIDKDVLLAIARASDGALRDAESILDQLVSFSQGKVAFGDVVAVLGVVQQEALFSLADKIIHKDAPGALALLNRLIEEGKDTSVFLASLIEHFRNLMVAKIARADAGLIDLPQDICAKLLEQSHAFSLEEIFSAFSLLANTQEMTKRLESTRIPLEIALVKLCHDKKETRHQAAAVKKDEPPAKSHHLPPPKAQAAPAPEPEPDPPPASDTPPGILLDDVKNTWKNIIDNLSAIKMSVATYLNEGTPLKIEKSTLTVAFPKSHSLHKEALEEKANRSLIEKMVEDFLRVRLRVNFILSEEAAVPEKEDDPLLRSALNAFKGRVVKDE